MLKPLLSLILPTKNRVVSLDRFLVSVQRTTNALDAIEIVLVIDEDDRASREYSPDPAISVARVVVPAGMTMGELNSAGYAAAAGANVMLVNDDIEITTRHWDEQVFDVIGSHADGVYLIHVNDGIFEDKLCTFPLVSRAFCEMHGGICPPGYGRYRIDDHIYNVFNLLNVLGKNRIFYLPEVRFAHHNYVTLTGGSVEYQPDPVIHAADTQLFDELLASRKELAVALAARIDEKRHRQVAQTRREILTLVNDSVSLRRREFVRRVAPSQPPTTTTDRVTVAVVTGDLSCDHAQASIRALKRFTRNFELVILDNNSARDFNHAREMNRLIAACRTDYLVLLDDDVIVEPGWLDGMLKHVDARTGTVTPCHKAVDGTLSYAGVAMRPDRTGHHGHSLKIDREPMRIQTLCSAAMLIDLQKCGQLRFDERCSKYFQDIDYGLQVWESGFDVVCATNVAVTHIAGATLKQGSTLSNSLFEEHRQIFVEKWIDSSRYDRIAEGVWTQIPEIGEMLHLPRRLADLLQAPKTKDVDAYLAAAHRLFAELAPFPDLRRWVSDSIWAAVGDERPTLDDPVGWHLACLLAFTRHPILIERDRRGYNLLLFEGEYYGVPVDLGRYDLRHDHIHPSVIRAAGLAVLKALVESTPQSLTAGAPPSTPPASASDVAVAAGEKPVVIDEDYKGFTLVRAGRVYAVPAGTGRFKVKRIDRGDYPVWFDGADEESVRREIDELAPVHVEQGRNGFTIVRYGKYYAIPQDAGAFDYSRFLRSEYVQCFSDVNLGDIRRAVDAAAPVDRGPAAGDDVRKSASFRWVESSPVREHGHVGSYAIFSYEFKYFAIPREEGTFDYARFRAGRYTAAVVAHSLAELRQKIQQPTDPGDVLVLADRWSPRLEAVISDYVSRLGRESVALACAGAVPPSTPVRRASVTSHGDGPAILRGLQSGNRGRLVQELKRQHFGRTVISWDSDAAFSTAALEQAASDLSPSVEILFPGGDRRIYMGEDAHRLIYNKAYVSSMISRLGQPDCLELLEIGCSDGLVCDMMVRLGARKVTAVDIMQTTGCNYPDPQIEYRVMDASRLQFRDRSFDWAYSIATFEHLPAPRATLDEMFRVLKVGGYGYVQAGPLYYSPFGHHMFAYFGDQPWVHLRRTKAEIVRIAADTGIAARIEADLGVSAKSYVQTMLSNGHINGLKLGDYGLDAFRKRRDIKVLIYNVSKEGEELLNDAVLSEIGHIRRERLIEHGFELLFQRLS